MKRHILTILVAVLCSSLPGFAARGKKRSTSKTAATLAWAYVRDHGVVLLRKPADAKAVRGKLRRGELAEVLGTKSKGGVVWARLMAANPANLEEVIGWVESRSIEQFPPGRFPANRPLLDAMGGDYLKDFVAAHAVMVRFLVPLVPGKPLLVAYVGSRALPQVRLQVFSPANGTYVAGPFLSFPYAGMGAAIQHMKIQDLPGSGGECLISTENEPSELGSSFRKMVIRRVDAQGFHTLWQAPLELKNFAAYPSQTRVLSPPVKNIGKPGTKTTGKVTFEKHGGVTVPVWKGQVSFYVIGRDAPVQTLRFEKVCPWNGTRFEPLE
jgi:hypothetical protein